MEWNALSLSLSLFKMFQFSWIFLLFLFSFPCYYDRTSENWELNKEIDKQKAIDNNKKKIKKGQQQKEKIFFSKDKF